MFRAKVTVLRMMIVLALLASMVGVTAAQATEGPYYKVNGKRLLKTESSEFTTSIRSGAFEISTTSLKLTCGAASALKGAKLEGSTGHFPGQASETLQFSKCKIAGNGTGCLVGSGGSGVVETKPLISRLSYLEVSLLKGDPIMGYLTTKTGTLVMEIEFTPQTSPEKGKCTKTKTTVEVEGELFYGITGKALDSSGSSVKVKEEPAEAKLGGVWYNKSSPIGWEEEGAGFLREQDTDNLTMNGEPAELEFDQLIELVSKENWGVYAG